jgi:uncharacterized membrane protein
MSKRTVIGAAPLPGSVAVIGGLVAIVAIVAAAILFTSGNDAFQRLAILVALVGTIVPSLTAALDASRAARASHVAAEQTNGSLDGRIADAVATALQARRATDRVIVASPPDPDPLIVTDPADLTPG